MRPLQFGMWDWCVEDPDAADYAKNGLLADLIPKYIALKHRQVLFSFSNEPDSNTGVVLRGYAVDYNQPPTERKVA